MPSDLDKMLTTSSEKGAGRDEVLEFIDECLKQQAETDEVTE